MTHFSLNAYSADRVVIGVENTQIRKKLFQINFKSRDGSIFVSVPYAKLGKGRVGVIEWPQGNVDSLTIGSQMPVTSHSVKYVHHPDGEAHFSQDGKVFTSVRRKAVPLRQVGGHLFTVMIQGLNHFDDFSEKDMGTKRRGVVAMPVPDKKLKALKFVGRLYPSEEFAKQLASPVMNSPFIPILTPDGRKKVAIVLATQLFIGDNPYLLIVSVEEIGTIIEDRPLYVALMGGFDPEEIAFDHSKTTSFLMMFYPEFEDVSQLQKTVGSIDRV